MPTPTSPADDVALPRLCQCSTEVYMYERIKRELRLISRGCSMTMNAVERLMAFVDQLPAAEQVTPPVPPPPRVSMDEARERAILKRLRQLGYVPKVTER